MSIFRYELSELTGIVNFYVLLVNIFSRLMMDFFQKYLE